MHRLTRSTTHHLLALARFLTHSINLCYFLTHLIVLRWQICRPIGTNSGYLKAKLPIRVSPSYKVVELPPQTSSVSWNEQGEVIDFTFGYVMDRVSSASHTA